MDNNYNNNVSNDDIIPNNELNNIQQDNVNNTHLTNIDDSTRMNSVESNDNDGVSNKKNMNNKTRKIIAIAVVVVVILSILLCLICLLSKSSNNSTGEDNNQTQTDNNITEDIIENEEQFDNGDKNEDVVEKEEQSNNDNKNDGQTNTNDSYLPNTDIIRRSLGQTSKFDNGISIKLTDSIEFADDEGIYHKPRFIKIELSNDSGKNFYQEKVTYAFYSTYTDNPVKFIEEDYNYTSFNIEPIYMVGSEAKTEKSGCVLRKYASMDTSKNEGNGLLSDINYVVLKPGEKTTAYLLCYFREEIKDADIKTILLFNSTNKFMYFMD